MGIIGLKGTLNSVWYSLMGIFWPLFHGPEMVFLFR